MRIKRRIPGRRSLPGLCAVLVGLSLLAGCSGAGQTPPRTEIDAAIALFVSGQHERAVTEFEDLAQTIHDEETLREVYYYLGRSYLALGDNDRAIDSFAAGVSHGDTGPCVDYLEQLRALKEGTARNVRRSEQVTRRQLASLLVREFVFDGAEPPVPGDPDEAIRTAVGRGWMRALPDGALHGDATVTRAAFLVVMARLTADLGFGQTLLPPFADRLSERGTESVSGVDVSAAIEELATLRKNYGG